MGENAGKWNRLTKAPFLRSKKKREKATRATGVALQNYSKLANVSKIHCLLLFIDKVRIAIANRQNFTVLSM